MAHRLGSVQWVQIPPKVAGRYQEEDGTGRRRQGTPGPQRTEEGGVGRFPFSGAPAYRRGVGLIAWGTAEAFTDLTIPRRFSPSPI